MVACRRNRMGFPVTAAERQARLRKRRADAGLVQCNVWLPAHAVASVQAAADAIIDGMIEGRRLEVARLVDRASGKLRGIKS